jgi:4-hydroxy-3-polyprenylbenzoate decarboxylase
MPDRLIIAITGASGAIYGLRALHLARQIGLETHLIISSAARVTLSQETGTKISDVLALASITYQPHDIAASIASGSFPTRGMLVAPCSIKTLSAIANGYTDNLIARAADVCLKEGRPLLLMVRETPLHRGHLRLMDQAATSGAIIFPPVPSFYAHPESLQEVIDASVGRALMRMGFENPAYPRWTGP